VNPFLLAALYLAMALSPVLLAWASGAAPRSVMDELASGAGMLAFAILLAEFLLSGRFHTVSRRIGLDVTMRFHQLFARVALALAMIHPFLYRAPFSVPLPWDATRQLTLTTNAMDLMSGIAGWALLPALVVMAIGRDRIGMRYGRWRLTHGIGALAVAALLLHHTLEAGRYAADPALKALWIGLFAIAALSLVFVYLLKPLAQRAKPWRVRAAQPIAERTWELVLAPDGHKGLDYEAGEFAWINLQGSAFSVDENPFSIASAPASGGDLHFIIKELGDFTRSLGALTPGQRAYVDGPHGDLIVAGRTEPGIGLIAGGVGVAPLLGILRQMQLTGDPRAAALVYGNRTEAQIVCRAELDALAAGRGVETTYVVAEPGEGWDGRSGVVSAELLRELFDTPERREWLYVLCGPNAMMELAEATLLKIGVPSSRILSERFRYD